MTDCYSGPSSSEMALFHALSHALVWADSVVPKELVAQYEEGRVEEDTEG